MCLLGTPTLWWSIKKRDALTGCVEMARSGVLYQAFVKYSSSLCSVILGRLFRPGLRATSSCGGCGLIPTGLLGDGWVGEGNRRVMRAVSEREEEDGALHRLKV
jgi:hypothetical protein